jgi:hypothetical protein
LRIRGSRRLARHREEGATLPPSSRVPCDGAGENSAKVGLKAFAEKPFVAPICPSEIVLGRIARKVGERHDDNRRVACGDLSGRTGRARVVAALFREASCIPGAVISKVPYLSA